MYGVSVRCCCSRRYLLLSSPCFGGSWVNVPSVFSGLVVDKCSRHVKLTKLQLLKSKIFQVATCLFYYVKRVQC